MLSKIKEMFHTFPNVVTGVLFACALFITLFNKNGVISSSLLWQILLTSFLCVLGDLFYPQRKMTGRERIARRLLHYLYINLVVFGCARVFNWYDKESLTMNVFMFWMILTVFLTVSYTIQRKNKKLSALLNERLERYQNKI